jgi:hypothetical protein
MSNKFLATIIMYGACMASLSAQEAPGALHAAPMEQTALAGIVDGLTRHALFALLGTITLAGAIYIAYVCKHCNDLSTKRNNIHGRSVALLLFVAGLSAFGSSCTAAQRTRAADIRAEQAAENRGCSMNRHYDDRANAAYNSRGLYNGNSNLYGPSFCKFCGKRIANVHH